MAAPLARPARRAGSNSARARAATPRATRSAQKGGTARHEMPTATAALPRCLRSCTHSIAPRTLDRPVCCVATLLAFCLPDARSTYHRAPSGCSPATLARLHSHASLKDSPQYRARARPSRTQCTRPPSRGCRALCATRRARRGALRSADTARSLLDVHHPVLRRRLHRQSLHDGALHAPARGVLRRDRTASTEL